jgi:hypothetical protein
MQSVGLTAPANAVGLSGECRPAARYVLQLRGSRDGSTRSRRTGVDFNGRAHAALEKAACRRVAGTHDIQYFGNQSIAGAGDRSDLHIDLGARAADLRRSKSPTQKGTGAPEPSSPARAAPVNGFRQEVAIAEPLNGFCSGSTVIDDTRLR